MTEPTTPTPTTVAKITPKNPAHCLFGRVLHIVRVEGEYIVAKIEDGLHWIEAKFHVSQIDVVTSIPVLPPVATPTPVEPVTEPPAPSPVVDPPSPLIETPNPS